jgi:3-oxoacyl-[acyl-carrier-protein] synthase-3
MKSDLTQLFVKIDCIDYYLPNNIETADTLLKENPDWVLEDIKVKTGIDTRYVSDINETALDLGIKAAEKLFLKNDFQSKIDAIIFVTQSPDYLLPTSACIIQDKLKLSTNCIAFDVNQGCSGFIYGLALSSSLVTAQLAKKVLLICSDTYTKYIDKHDRTCRPIFSDGAAACVISLSSTPCIGPFELGTDGRGALNLIVKNSAARISNKQDYINNKLFMDGSKVFMFSMNSVPECVKNLLTKAKKKINEIDLFIFHQASKIVIDNIIRRLNLPKEKIFCNYSRIGNTVSASIPIALKDSINEGILKSGDLVMVIGFGVGYSWGATLVRWGDK